VELLPSVMMDKLVAPTVDWCGFFKKADASRFIPGQQYIKRSFTLNPLNKSARSLTAGNRRRAKIAWEYHSQRSMLASVATTSADLVFTGELTGDFVLFLLDALEGQRG
jgi:hypothetical protein